MQWSISLKFSRVFNKICLNVGWLLERKMRNIRFRKRLSTSITFVAIFCIVLLLIRMQDINMKIREMEIKIKSTESQKTEKKSNPELLDLYKQYKRSNQLHLLNPDELNNTKNAGLDMVFFNRVPKVGSQSFSELMRRLSLRNNFRYLRDERHEIRMGGLSDSQQEEYVNMMLELTTPSAFAPHMCFVNFTKFDHPSPIYVNMVRNPVDRVPSWFYYIRTPWYYIEMHKNNRNRPLPTVKHFLKDFDKCVLEGGDPECTFPEGDLTDGLGDHRRQTVWFCGHDPECRPFNTQDVLERSIHAVETQYSVVGVLEDMKTTLAVFEKYIPRFFAGASEIYYNDMTEFKNINQNKYKPAVSDEVKNILRKNFSKEIEFYEFCKKRLQTQFLAAHLDEF